MRGTRVLRGLAALTMLTSLVAACGDDDDGETTPVEETDDGATDDGGATVEAQEIDITAIDYAYSEAPTEIDAGLVTANFTNDGKVSHEIALIEIGDTPLEEFLPEFAPAVSEGGPFPEVAQNVAAPIEEEPGGTASVTFTVAEGTYALLCTLTGDAEGTPAEGEDEAEGDLHLNRGMAQVLTVNAGEDAELPEADGSITASDYTFDVDVSADDETINFVNDGPDQIHFGAILEFPEGTDEATALESFGTFISLEEGQAPPEGTVEPSDDDFGFTGVFSTGLGAHITPTKSFQPGRTYVIACFISDRAGGPPHALPEEAGGHGMVQAFTVE